MSRQAQRKGIDLLATGDWTHPAWFGHLQEELEEWQAGIYISRQVGEKTKFLLSTELSCIYTQAGKGRRIHLLVFSPNLEVCAKIITALQARGANLASDGRPIIGLSCIQLAELIFGIDQNCMIIPAHAWTPWFGIYGSRGGFDSLTEAFGEFEDQIVAIETGLSSDPEMNWRIGELDRRAIVSFGDAHSPSKMGREVTVFSAETTTFSYHDVRKAISAIYLGENTGMLKLDYTVEYYPEEGKYHWDGHRVCGVVHTPAETRTQGTTCPVCGKTLTVGVEYRVEQLATHSSEAHITLTAAGTQCISAAGRIPYLKAVPLQEILALVEGKAVSSKTVQQQYDRLVTAAHSEFELLFRMSLDELNICAGDQIKRAIEAVRLGKLRISPGFDGQYGTIELEIEKKSKQTDQLQLF